HRRSVYCGSIGYISFCGQLDTSITIGTLLCENNKIHCWAGGGIVADSVSDMEYEETYNKVNNLLQSLENTL
ncbi:chorismate-binding protein, partial [Pontibacterium sp.]|uniref:chorismate-binding protein n=1 Tax=Pontibacterium sp. TaxID=2036026 RepID=UPI003562B769